MKSQILSLKPIKRFMALNKKLYLLAALAATFGLVLGLVLAFSGGMESVIYSSTGSGLYEIIINDYSAFGLLAENLYRLLLPIIIIFLLSLSKYTSPLSYVYLGYQGCLLGASIVGLISSNGVMGVLNAIVMVLPINTLNFVVLISALVVFLKRLSLALSQRISLVHSLKIFMPKLVYVFVSALVVSMVYAFLYPLLLRSVIVINY